MRSRGGSRGGSGGGGGRGGGRLGLGEAHLFLLEPLGAHRELALAPAIAVVLERLALRLHACGRQPLLPAAVPHARSDGGGEHAVGVGRGHGAGCRVGNAVGAGRGGEPAGAQLGPGAAAVDHDELLHDLLHALDQLRLRRQMLRLVQLKRHLRGSRGRLHRRAHRLALEVVPIVVRDVLHPARRRRPVSPALAHADAALGLGVVEALLRTRLLLVANHTQEKLLGMLGEKAVSEPRVLGTKENVERPPVARLQRSRTKVAFLERVVFVEPSERTGGVALLLLERVQFRVPRDLMLVHEVVL